MSLNLPLYLALAAYAAGTVVALLSLLAERERLQKLAVGPMLLGFLAHTIWIGIICSMTQHPPLTNLPEALAFISWTILAVELLLLLRYRVYAASFFVYPFVLVLLTISAIVREQFVQLDPALRSNLFIAHLFFSSLGVAALFVALAFTLLYHLQERSLKRKKPNRLERWIPSLRICDLLSYRSLTIGFAIYTLGIVAGVLWSYRSGAPVQLRVKEIGAFTAWIMFAALLQSYFNGSYRTRKTLVISAVAFVSILAALFGIEHV